MSVSPRLGEKKQVQLPQGTIHYRETGEGPPIVFVHGLIVNGDLWRKLVPELSSDFRCIAPDWPLGSHSEPMNPDANLTLPDVANIVADFLEALDLSNVTLVGNDSGGAISQIVITTRPERIGRLVLTSCDAFEIFPPRMFKYLLLVPKLPGGMFTLAQSMRLGLARRLPIAYGALTNEPLPREISDSYARPMFENAGVRADVRKFLLTKDPTRYTIEAGRKLKNFDKPVLLAWDDEDRFFKYELAQRLANEFPNAQLKRLTDARTFSAEDQPQQLATMIREFALQPAAA